MSDRADQSADKVLKGLQNPQKTDSEKNTDFQTTNERLDDSAGDCQLRKGVVDAVIVLNKDFGYHYNQVWIKSAEEEGFLEYWIEELLRNEIEPAAILKAAQVVLSDERYREFPPSLRSFLDLCRNAFSEALPDVDEAYLQASGETGVILKNTHVVVQETVRRVGQFRVRSDGSVRSEFGRTYRKVCDEYRKGQLDLSRLKAESSDTGLELDEQDKPMSDKRKFAVKIRKLKRMAKK